MREKVYISKEEKQNFDYLKVENYKIKLALQKRGIDYEDLLKEIMESYDDIKQNIEDRKSVSTETTVNSNEVIKSLREQGYEIVKLPPDKFSQSQENFNKTVYVRDGLSFKQQQESHNEAMDAAKKYLEQKGYKFSDSDFEENESDKFFKWHSASQIHNVLTPSKEKVIIIVSSCKGGRVYLSATDFQSLTSSKENVLILYDKDGCHSVSYEELFAKGDVNLIFDTEYTPHHYFAALGKIFTYIKRSTFAVKNPRYDVTDEIKGFGMDSETLGLQNDFDDDNDL